MLWEFPAYLVVRIPDFHCCGPGSIPGWGTEIPQAMQHGQKRKKKKRERKLKKKQKKTWYDMSAPAAIMKLGEGNIILRKRGARGRLK